MNNLFKFKNNDIEVLVHKNEPLFDPYQIGKCLDLAEKTVQNKISGFEEGTEKIKLTNLDISQGTPLTGTLSNFGKYYITEAGLYTMVIESRKPEAIVFKRWICQEVLPSIRKTGTYTINQTQMPTIAISTQQELAIRDFNAIMSLSTILKIPESVLAVDASQEVDKKYGTAINNLVKKSPLLDNIKEEEQWLEPADIGKKINKSGTQINKELEKAGLQCKINGNWTITDLGKPYAKLHQWTTKDKSGYNYKWNIMELKKYWNIDI